MLKNESKEEKVMDITYNFAMDKITMSQECEDKIVELVENSQQEKDEK